MSTPREVLVKSCSKCGTEKPTTEFYSDKYTRDRLHPSCKDCARRAARERYYRDHDKIMEAEARRRKKPEHRAKNRVYRKQSDARDREKVNARRQLCNAVRAGKIQRLPCHKCGNPKSQGHHEDYSRALDVEWICATCHAKEHRTSPEGIADLGNVSP